MQLDNAEIKSVYRILSDSSHRAGGEFPKGGEGNSH